MPLINRKALSFARRDDHVEQVIALVVKRSQLEDHFPAYLSSRVLLRAWHDAFYARYDPRNQNIRPDHYDDAIKFFERQEGPWRESLETHCDISGINMRWLLDSYRQRRNVHRRP